MFDLPLLDPDPPGWLHRATGRRPAHHAWAELHNAIAAAASLFEFGPATRERIERATGVDLSRAFADECRRLYADVLARLIADDGRLAAADRHALAHLARTLALPPDVQHALHEQAFGAAVAHALTDACLDDDERLLLFTLQHALGLARAEATYEAHARRQLLTLVRDALCDGWVTADEQAALEEATANLGLALPDDVRVLLAQARQRRHLFGDAAPAERPLAPTWVPTRLDAGETGHLVVDGSWSRLNYARLRTELHRHRALLHRGETARLAVPKKALAAPDFGQIVLTDRRLVLVRAGARPISYDLHGLDVERFANGLRLTHRGERGVLVEAGRQADLLETALGQAIRTRRGAMRREPEPKVPSGARAPSPSRRAPRAGRR